MVRGAALTAIDLVLALTLGRGHRPARSDLTIVLVSRTGRLMLPKAEPPVMATVLACAGDLTEVREAVAAGKDVPDLLADVAIRILGSDPSAERSVRDAIGTLLVGGSDPPDPVDFLRHGVAMARGRRPPDVPWALGQAWRLLYPDLVARQRLTLSGPPLGWPGYSDSAQELERLAFGPPLVNAELLLEGLESGSVCVRRGGVGELAGRADLVVDAVLPPPGIVDAPTGQLLAGLAEAGLLSHDPARRGAQVAHDGTVIGRSGTPVPGLALVGRATEGHLLGNDTLVRSLHPEIDGWARRVLSPAG